MSAHRRPEPDSSLDILHDFHQLYQQRLDQSRHLHGDSTDVQMKTLHDWVRDLTEQNNLLVQTVEELEKEALERVKMLDEITRTSGQNNLQLHELAENSQRMTKLECFVETLKCQLKEKEAMICDYVQKLKKYEKTIKILKGDVNCDMSRSESTADGSDLKKAIELKNMSLQERNNPNLRYLDSDASNSQCEMDKNMISGSREVTLLESEVSFLQETLREKEYEAENHLRKICQLQEYIDSRELQCLSNTRVDVSSMTELSDVIALSKVGDELKLKEEETERLRARLKECEMSHGQDKQILALRENIVQLQRASRDVQSALTAEVAEKHDAIVALRRETSQLEEQLRQSDMQTHFKDDIIKQLRKEVKLARAKDSLAEMLGLKECPRVQMKEKIERLSAELEERELAISRLEERLETKQVQALEENISRLGSQLSSRERDLLTLCNKMDYVRRYVKRLRDDEDLSVKCGLEALLHELNEDSEWNKETRKSVTSLTEGGPNDVIVINRVPARSHSLPSDTHSPLHLHKHQPTSNRKRGDWSGCRTWSESPVEKYESAKSRFSNEKLLNLEQDEVDKLRELQNELERNRGHLTKLWKEIKTMSMEVSNNTIYNDLEEFKEETKGHQEMLAQVVCDLEKLVQPECQKDVGKGEYLLSCIEANLSGMMDLLKMESFRNQQQLPSYESCTHCSDPDFYTTADSLAGNITESLSYIGDIRESYQELREQQKARNKESDILKELLLILSDIMDSKQRTLQKISHIQKIQGESYCSISTKFREFDKAYTCHTKTEHAISKELSKIICRATYEQPQAHDGSRNREGSMTPLRKARSEVKTLKQALSAREQEIMKKDRTICILKKSLSQKNLVKTSQSAPLPGSSSMCVEYDSDPMSNFDEKVSQAQEVVNQVRKQMEEAMCNLLSREEKLSDVEKDMINLRRTLNSVQVDVNDINQSVKDLRECTEQPNAKKKVDAPLRQLELEVNRLISKLQDFAREKECLERSRIESQRGIATLQSDLSNIQVDLGESVKEIKMQMPVNLFKFPSAKEANENTVENLQCQLDIYKQKVERLEDDLMRATYSGDVLPYNELTDANNAGWAEGLVDPGITLGTTQQQILEIQEDMRKSLDEALSCNLNDSQYRNDSQDSNSESDHWKKKYSNLQKEHDQRLQTIANQQETIRLLEENLDRLQCEACEMSKQIESIKWEKESAEMENQQAMQELQAKICSLQAELQRGSTNTPSQSMAYFYFILEELLAEYAKCYTEALACRSESWHLREANLELCVTAGLIKEEYTSLKETLAKLYSASSRQEKERQASTAALQLAVTSQMDKMSGFEQREADWKEQRSTLKKELKEKACQLLKTEQELNCLREAMSRSEVDTAIHKKQISELSHMVRELKQCLSDREEKGSTEIKLQEAVQRLQEVNRELKVEKTFLQNELEQERKCLALHCEQIASIKNDLIAKTSEYKKLEKHVRKNKETLDELLSENRDLLEKNNALEKVKKEKCDLMREKGEMMGEYQAKLKGLQDEDMEWSRRYKAKCEETAHIGEHLEECKAECENQKGTIARLKEGADYLSGKVAQLCIFVDEKEKTVRILESQLNELNDKYQENEAELKIENLRVCKLEEMLDSMSSRVDTLQSMVTLLEKTNHELTREKCALEEWAMEKCRGEEGARRGSLLSVCAAGRTASGVSVAKRDLVTSCRIFKKKLHKTLDQNKCLLRMVHNLKMMNCLLKREMREKCCQDHQGSPDSSEEGRKVRTQISLQLEESQVSQQQY